MVAFIRRAWCRVWHGSRGRWVEEIIHDRDGAMYTATCASCGSVFYEEQGLDHD